MADDIRGKILQFPGTKTKKQDAEPVTFKGFHFAAAQGDHRSAADMLTTLLGIPADAARDCTQFYVKKLHEDPQHPFKTMSLREEAANGVTIQGMSLLYECFGLQGPLAVIAFQTIVAANNH